MEPALAFQLEINRMSNFDLQVIPSLNPRMHLYLGSAKVFAFVLLSVCLSVNLHLLKHKLYVTFLTLNANKLLSSALV